MAILLWQRDITSDLDGVENTYSSWDTCMTKAYWSAPPYHGLVVEIADTVSQQMAGNRWHYRRLTHCPVARLVSRPMSLLRRRMLLRLFGVL